MANEFIARNGVIAQNNSIVSGSLTVTEGISGSFSGSGANLFDIPASGITGLNLSQISSGSVSASISPSNGLQVNTNVIATSFTGSLSGSTVTATTYNNLPTASATTDGIITTGSQTINGSKTFIEGITTNGVTITNLGSTNANIAVIGDDSYYVAASGRTHYFGGTPGNVANNLSVPLGSITAATYNNLPTASATTDGIITTGSQTIAGSKTFTSYPTLPTNGGNSGQGAIIIDNGSGLLQVAYNGTYPNLSELETVKGVTSPIQTQLDTSVITVTTTTSIDTNTTGSNGFGQHGRHTKISNGANVINLTVQTSSNAEFVASYDKIGTSTITFVAGTGATLTTLSGTAALSGVAGSKACLSRNGNTYFLQITNY